MLLEERIKVTEQTLMESLSHSRKILSNVKLMTDEKREGSKSLIKTYTLLAKVAFDESSDIYTNDITKKSNTFVLVYLILSSISRSR